MPPWFYYLGTYAVKLLLFLLTRYQVIGKENIPTQGALIIAANHLSNIDPPLLSASIPRRIVFMAKGELFWHPIFGPLTRGWHAFPVYRGRLDLKALRRAQQVLQRGMVLGMFPEAMRSANSQLQPAYTGVALISLKNESPILPVGITGSEKILKSLIRLRRPHVTVNIGKPFIPPSNESKRTKEKLIPATDFIMMRIAELLPQSYRGHYGDREGV